MRLRVAHRIWIAALRVVAAGLAPRRTATARAHHPVEVIPGRVARDRDVAVTAIECIGCAMHLVTPCRAAAMRAHDPVEVVARPVARDRDVAVTDLERIWGAMHRVASCRTAAR